MIQIELPAPSERIFLSDYEMIKNKPGFYIIRNKKAEVVYIGESIKLRSRLRKHFYGKSKTTRYFRHLFCFADVFYCDETEAKIYEIYAIDKFKPPGNVKDNTRLKSEERKEWIRKEAEEYMRQLEQPIKRVPIKINREVKE